MAHGVLCRKHQKPMKTFAIITMILLAGPPTATVDLIEINHCYDDAGQLRFVQVIYWDRGHVREWHMIDRVQVVYSHQGGFKVVRETKGRTEVIWGRAGKTTWTWADPEEQDRRLRPVGKRVPLFGR